MGKSMLMPVSFLLDVLLLAIKIRQYDIDEDLETLAVSVQEGVEQKFYNLTDREKYAKKYLSKRV